jgi:hypothetical protein
VITQLAEFEPHGLFGIVYWYLLTPIHEVMFRGMLRRIAAEARHPEIHDPEKHAESVKLRETEVIRCPSGF